MYIASRKTHKPPRLQDEHPQRKDLAHHTDMKVVGEENLREMNNAALSLARNASGRALASDCFHLTLACSPAGRWLLVAGCWSLMRMRCEWGSVPNPIVPALFCYLLRLERAQFAVCVASSLSLSLSLSHTHTHTLLAAFLFFPLHAFLRPRVSRCRQQEAGILNGVDGSGTTLWEPGGQ